MKIYTIISPHDTLAKNKINDLITLNHLKLDDVTVYDMETSPVTDALFDVNSAGFFVERKAVVIKNPYFFTASIFKGPLHDLDKLMSYLNRPSDNNILIIHCPYEKLDERKKIVKLLKKKTDLIKIDAPNEYNIAHFVKQEFHNANIKPTDASIRQLLFLTKNNFDKVISEINKIISYIGEDESRELTLDIIDELVPKTLEDNVFLLTESFVAKDIIRSHQIFNDLMIQREEPIKLIIMLANQFRLLKQVKVMHLQGKYEKQIATDLGIHPYRIKLALQQSRNFNLDEITKRINQLAQLDINVKTGKFDAQTGLEFFILS